MIELVPNWHPVWVHFAVALLITSAAAHAIALVRRSKAGGVSHALIVARWTSWMGVAAAGLAVVTGFWAAGSVAHDDAAHANMMVHRNWAIAALVLFAVAALVELIRRRQIRPSVFTAVFSLGGAVSILITAYEGGQNVFEHGLGVQRLPEVSTHDHDAHAHEPAPQDSAPPDAGSHDHDAHAHGPAPQDSAPPNAGSHDHGAHDHEPTPGKTGSPANADGLAAISDQLFNALAAGDAESVARLLDEDVLVFESGHLEASRAEYQGHHLPADMSFSAAVDRQPLSRRVMSLGENGAVVSTRSRLTGRYRERDIDDFSTETLVLRRLDGEWRIAHIHWSASGD